MSFDGILPDILGEITNHLSEKDVINLASVNKHMCENIDKLKQFIKIVDKKFPTRLRHYEYLCGEINSDPKLVFRYCFNNNTKANSFNSRNVVIQEIPKIQTPYDIFNDDYNTIIETINNYCRHCGHKTERTNESADNYYLYHICDSVLKF